MYLEGTDNEHMRCFGHFKMAFSYWMTKNYELIGFHIQQVKKWVKLNFEHDLFAKRMAHKYEQINGFSNLDTLLIRIENLIMAKQFQQAQELIHDMESTARDYLIFDEDPIYLTIWSSYYRGKIEVANNNLKEAEYLFLNVVLPLEDMVKGTPNIKVIPFTLVELGEISMKINEPVVALFYFRQAKEYRNYEFARYLYYRIVRNLEVDINDHDTVESTLEKHDWEETRFHKLSTCAVCDHKIMSLRKGFYCKGCDNRIHKKCITSSTLLPHND
eukprot:TRINITY_DN5620_c0_g1_i2.p2 TRINITY_DN5620_c0_g1~~TRINITY_DN5620_c0_g1_i2.p2  ORF type:complete len:273 (+),score=51.82 TRINITY_DN5620_c0_g1_i2:1039-1857(+)